VVKYPAEQCWGTASFIGLILIAAAIFSPVTSVVTLPVLLRSATGALSFGLAEVPFNAMFIVLVGFCTSIMWGSIFNLAVEGFRLNIRKPHRAFFMALVCGGGILPAIQGQIADMAGYINSYWLIFVGLAYLLYYALIGSKNVNPGYSDR